MRQWWLVLAFTFGLILIGVYGGQPAIAAQTELRIEATAAVGDTTRVSVRSSGEQGNNESYSPDVSDDGRYVVFASAADNLVSGDDNDLLDIFVHDRATLNTERVSVSSGGTEGNSDSFAPVISGNGRYVAFCSWATNLVGGDDNNVVDVFYHDRDLNSTNMVSRDIFNGVGNDVSCEPDPNPVNAVGPDISKDGRYIVFSSFATDLVGNDNNGEADIFRFDRETGGMQRISVDKNGAEANGASGHPAISDDGQRIVFQSEATNLVPGDGEGYLDVFIRNLHTGETNRMSVQSNGDGASGDSFEPNISGDGVFVVFSSFANNIVSGDDNNFLDVFIRDRDVDVTTIASVSGSGAQPNVFAQKMEPAVSEHGRFVVFQSYADNLAPGESDTSTRDVFVRDRQEDTTVYASVSTGGEIGNSSSREPVISTDGYFVVFSSKADNLVSNDVNNDRDIFVHQLQDDTPPPPPPPPSATLTVNHRTGAPSSVFAFSGSHYGANQSVAILVNKLNVGVVTADGSGDIVFRLDTDPTTLEGAFFVQAFAGSQIADVVFYVDADAPTRLAGGGGPLFDVPNSAAYGELRFLPAIRH